VRSKWQLLSSKTKTPFKTAHYKILARWIEVCVPSVVSRRRAPGPAICRTHAVTFYAANLSVPDTVSLFCFQNRF